MKSAAFAIIFNENQTKILLVKRKDVPLWTLPGGGIEVEETPAEAAIREVKEETGLNIKIVRQSGNYTPVNRLAAHTSVFISSIISGHPSLSSETAAIDFFPLTSLPNTFFEIHQNWLQDALTHTTTVCKELHNVNYVNLIKYFLRHPWLTIRYLWTRICKK